MAFTVTSALFEGLFVRGLQVDEDFARELVAVGFDPRKMRPEYPVEVWVACLEVAWRRRFPALERLAAFEQLGYELTQGYLDTIVGNLVRVALPLLPPRPLLTRTPLFLSGGLTGVKATVAFPGEKHGVLTLEGPHAGSAHVLAGVARKVFELQGQEARVAAELGEGLTSRLHVHWK